MLESIRSYIRLLHFIKGYWWAFSLSIVGFLIFAATQPALAKMMEAIIEAIQQKDTEQRLILPLIAVGIFFARGFGTFLGTFFNSYLAASVIRKIQKKLFQHLIHLPAEFYDRQNQGQILHRLGSGVGQIQGAITTALKIVIREGLTVIFLVGYVFYLNWKLSLAFLAVAPILAYLVSYVGRRFKKIARSNERILGQTSQVSKELISNHAIVRAFGAEDYERQRYNSNLDQVFEQSLILRRITALFSPVSQLIIAIAMAGVIYMLLSPSMLEHYSTGDLVGYLTAIALLPKSIRQLSGVGITIQQGAIGSEIIFGILDEPPEEDNGTIELKKVDGELQVKRLKFTYPRGDREVLKDISFHVSPGEMVALVGKSGSGKSTLANLLCRHYPIENGSIYLDNTDINDIKLESLRQNVATVNQNIALFDDTIRNNVAYGDRSVSEEAVIEALEKAHAMEFIKDMPHGIHTMIGENGLQLSGGQRQRISIARAFLKNAPILIMDEATSALDNESENKITQAIEELIETRTTIVIAHRLSTILKANRLLVMKEGQIVESGTHLELVKKNGLYSQLYRSEFSS